MSRHLVLAGGGHAHLTTLVNAARIRAAGHRVTLVSPLRHQYYSGMGPGLLGGYYSADDIRFDVGRMAVRRGVDFTADRVVRIDPQRRSVLLASGSSLGYDILSCAVGSGVPDNLAADGAGGVLPVKPIENLGEGRRRARAMCRSGSCRLLVIGGGLGGVEITGNLREAVDPWAERAEIVLLAGHRLLEDLPAAAVQEARRRLERRNVEIVEGPRVAAVRDGRVELDDGRILDFDLCFLAVGVSPSALFHRSGLPVGPDGGLRVNTFLQCEEHPQIFGGGDCVHFAPRPLAKVGVYAVRQNPVLFHNLHAALEDRPLVPFDPGGGYLLVANMGDGSGVFFRGRFHWSGRTAFRIKDWIDRRFMRKFKTAPVHPG